MDSGEETIVGKFVYNFIKSTQFESNMKQDRQVVYLENAMVASLSCFSCHCFDFMFDSLVYDATLCKLCITLPNYL